MSSRDYQRKYIRAPFREEILYVDDEFVFKGRAINISEGGLLLSEVGHFPKQEMISFMVCLPQLPRFKNFTLERIQKYNKELLAPQVIRFEGCIARTFQDQTDIDGVFLNKIGLDIKSMAPLDQQKVGQYVEVFAGNLIYLLVLIDNLENDKTNLSKVRLVSEFLGYSKDFKISVLRQHVELDYHSLQWC